jgi:hypothetical protein
MPQESEEGICPYLGRSLSVGYAKEKSAAVVVADGNELA